MCVSISTVEAIAGALRVGKHIKATKGLDASSVTLPVPLPLCFLLGPARLQSFACVLRKVLIS